MVYKARESTKSSILSSVVHQIFDNMKSLIFLACLCGVALAGDRIDYSKCQWLYGSATNTVSCPNGYIGVGACGNKGQNRCGGKAFGIKCCNLVGQSKN